MKITTQLLDDVSRNIKDLFGLIKENTNTKKEIKKKKACLNNISSRMGTKII